MKLDHGTPSVSGLALVFGFGFGFHHAQPPRSKSGSLAMFDAMRLASSLLSSLAAERRPGIHELMRTYPSNHSSPSVAK
jgi:hypothetical protein